MVLGNTGFTSGRNRWAVRIDRSPTAYLFVGIASTAANQASFLGSDAHGWGFIGDKALYHRRDRVRTYGERFGQGDVVGVELDMDRGLVSFSRNGVDLGVAFRGLSGELFPAVAFYNLGQTVSLVPQAFECPGAGVLVPGAPSHVTPAQVAGMAAVLRCMARNARLAAAACASGSRGLELAQARAGVRAPGPLSAATGVPAPACVAACLPRPFLTAAWRQFDAWRRGAVRRYVTQSGFEVTFNCGDAACGRFGVVSGDRVMTPRGEGEVIGVWDGRVWVHVDGDIGAWFLHCRPLAEAVEGPTPGSPAPGVPAASAAAGPGAAGQPQAPSAPAPPLSPAPGAPLSTGAPLSSARRREDGDRKDGDVVEREEKDVEREAEAGDVHGPLPTVGYPLVPLRVDGDGQPTPPGGSRRARGPSDDPLTRALLGVTYTQFTALCAGARWPLDRDDTLVWVSGQHCEKEDCSPWNVVASQLALVALPFVPPAAPCLPRPSDILCLPGPSLVQVGGDLVDVPAAVELCARYALLQTFNDHLLSVLPLQSLATLASAPPGPPAVEGLPVGGSGLGGSGSGSGSGVDPPAQVGSSLPGGDNGVSDGSSGASLASTLAGLRGAVFLHTKKQVLATVLDRTQTRTKPADDDYDYPEELPQVCLSRPRAAFARVLPSPMARLGHSLLGQALEQLHCLPPSTLRFCYMHPMDDGQQRCFKVRFEGEGADDYGGPYRECFAQIVQEVQATQGNSSGFGDTASGSPSATALAGSVDVDMLVMRSAGEDGGVDGAAPGSGSNDCVLPLLMPCPNRVAGSGVNRELFVLTPCVLELTPLPAAGGGPSGSLYDAYYGPAPWPSGHRPAFYVPAGAARTPMVLTPLLVEFYRFLGRVIGVAVRSRVQLPFLLAPSFWKAMVCSQASLLDLAAIDTSAAAVLTQLKQARDSTLPFVTMEEHGDPVPGFDDLMWTTSLSDGCEVELVPGGSSIPVSLRDVDAYCAAVTQARLQEAAPATRAILEGLLSVVPAAVLPILTAREFELMVCGSGDVDVDLLQRNTEYDEDVSPSDPHIQSFWRVLRSFTPGQRQQFLRFVWARSRLPTTSSEFTQKFKMQAAVAEVTPGLPAPGSEGSGTGGSAGVGSGTSPGDGAASSARPPSASASSSALAVVGTQLAAGTARGTSGGGLRSARRSFTTVGAGHTVAAAAAVSASSTSTATAPNAVAGSASTAGITSAASSAALVRPGSHAALRGSGSEVSTGGGGDAQGDAQVEVEGLPTTARRRPSSSRAGAAVLRSARRSFMRRPSMGDGLLAGGAAVGGAGAARGFGPAVDVVSTPDAYLPKAHTCFFSLNLPKYTSDKVMREKLLYAIFNCQEMDGDFRLTESEMTGWD